jgi:hypothetical protein
MYQSKQEIFKNIYSLIIDQYLEVSFRILLKAVVSAYHTHNLHTLVLPGYPEYSSERHWHGTAWTFTENNVHIFVKFITVGIINTILFHHVTSQHGASNFWSPLHIYIHLDQQYNFDTHSTISLKVCQIFRGDLNGRSLVDRDTVFRVV